LTNKCFTTKLLDTLFRGKMKLLRDFYLEYLRRPTRQNLQVHQQGRH
jgi:hypothetical protein